MIRAHILPAKFIGAVVMDSFDRVRDDLHRAVDALSGPEAERLWDLASGLVDEPDEVGDLGQLSLIN